MGSSDRKAIVAVLAAAALALAAPAASAVGTTTPAPTGPPTAQAALFGISGEKLVCDVVREADVGPAAGKLIAKGARLGRFGSLLVDVMIASALDHCEQLLGKVTEVAVSIYHQLRPSGGRSTIAAYLSVQQQQSAAAIAARVLVNGRAVSARYVLGAADALCGALRARSSPASALARSFPGAGLNLLGPMNGVVRLAITRCSLGAAEAEFVNGAMLNYLLANGSGGDVEAPTAWIHSVTGTRYTNGTARLTARWIGTDRSSGVASYAVWMWRDGNWHRLADGTASSGWTIDVRQGVRYQFAVRATDRSGNVSSWAYAPVYVA